MRPAPGPFLAQPNEYETGAQYLPITQVQMGSRLNGVLYSNENILVPQNESREDPEACMKQAPNQVSNVCVFWENVTEHGVEEPMEDSVLVVWIGPILLPVDEAVGAAWIA